MTVAQPLKFESPDQGEDLARADLYGLLAALFYGPASQELIDTIAAAEPEGEGLLQLAWADLVNASKTAKAEPVREEYEHLFMGVGKPEVMLYGSYYLSGFLMERPLALLRTDLANMGLERVESVVESEDHIASLCEVMRYLIASDDVMASNVAAQKSFFSDHVSPWANDMCDRITSHPDANYYAAVAHVAQTFFSIEVQAFDMS